MAGAPKVRLNADISPDVANALKTLAKKQGINLTEALSRAIGTEYALADARSKGGRVLIKQDDQIRELMFTGIVSKD